MSNAVHLLMYQYFFSIFINLNFAFLPSRQEFKKKKSVACSTVFFFCIRSHSRVDMATSSLLRNLSTPKLQVRYEAEVSPILNKTILILFDSENVSFVRALNF